MNTFGSCKEENPVETARAFKSYLDTHLKTKYGAIITSPLSDNTKGKVSCRNQGWVMHLTKTRKLVEASFLPGGFAGVLEDNSIITCDAGTAPGVITLHHAPHSSKPLIIQSQTKVTIIRPQTKQGTLTFCALTIQNNCKQ